ALVVRVVDRVEDEPSLLESGTTHGLLSDCGAYGAASAVSADEVVGPHLDWPAVRRELRGDAIVVLREAVESRAVTHLDIRKSGEAIEEDLLELRVVHRVLDRMPIGSAGRTSAVEQQLP